MPGIDRSRVVGKDDDELDDLTCSICQDIFEDPVVAQCCRQSFCRICISQWLTHNNTCPNDRKNLTTNQLLPAPRIVTNLLNKLKVKCNNYGNGCQSVLTFEEMVNHMKDCNTCDSCKTSKQLLIEKQKEIEIFRTKMIKDKDELAQLTDQLKELRALSNSRRQTGVDVINNAKGVLPKEEKIFGLCESETNFLIGLAKSAILKENSLVNISKSIHDNIKSCDDLKSYNWVILTYNKDDTCATFASYHKYLRISFNALIIKFMGYKMNLHQVDEIQSARVMFGQLRLVERKDVDDRLFDSFVNECRIAINCQDTFNGVAKQLREKLAETTKTDWLVLANTTNISFSVKCFKKIIVNINRLKIQSFEVKR